MSALAAGPVRTYKLDASSEGCTGLFFRQRSASGAFSTVSESAWPRNGAIIRGVEAVPGWVQLEARAARWPRSSRAACGGAMPLVTTPPPAAAVAPRTHRARTFPLSAFACCAASQDKPDRWLPVAGHGHTYLHEQK